MILTLSQAIRGILNYAMEMHDMGDSKYTEFLNREDQFWIDISDELRVLDSATGEMLGTNVSYNPVIGCYKFMEDGIFFIVEERNVKIE